MLAVIRLEMVGYPVYQYINARERGCISINATLERQYLHALHHAPRPGVFDSNGKPMTGNIDWSKSSGTGMRGIFCYYPLVDGIYQVIEAIDLSKRTRYTIEAINGKYHKITE